MGEKMALLIMGYPCAGKTTYAEQLRPRPLLQRYGTIRLAPQDFLHEIESCFYRQMDDLVIEDCFADRLSRHKIINLARKHKIPIACYHIETSLDDAQLNVCNMRVRQFHESPRIHKPLPSVEELYRYRRRFQEPSTDEGFSWVKHVPFVRKWPEHYTNGALIVDLDGTIRTTPPGCKHDYPTHPSQVVILPGRIEVLSRWQKLGKKILGVSNQSCIGDEKSTMTDYDVQECIRQTEKLLGIPFEVRYCPHYVNRVKGVECYCRKPLPLLGAELIYKYRLDPQKCLMVGDREIEDHGFARKCGFSYLPADVFFKHAEKSEPTQLLCP